ncbi:hypothetical protein [Burkholderia sp. Bp9143]|uniref:hypothetical protein n=1 Tax=Burkholderia sp. Bp9143 TaxID=2184574 RepID=UPI000F5AE519|nr:hypothetical protein [Burkholderia sp. Bp9143]
MMANAARRHLKDDAHENNDSQMKLQNMEHFYPIDILTSRNASTDQVRQKSDLSNQLLKPEGQLLHATGIPSSDLIESDRAYSGNGSNEFSQYNTAPAAYDKGQADQC